MKQALEIGGGVVCFVLGVLYLIAAKGIGEDVAKRRRAIYGYGKIGDYEVKGAGIEGYLLGGGLIVAAIGLWVAATIQLLRA